MTCTLEEKICGSQPSIYGGSSVRADESGKISVSLVGFSSDTIETTSRIDVW